MREDFESVLGPIQVTFSGIPVTLFLSVVFVGCWSGMWVVRTCPLTSQQRDVHFPFFDFRIIDEYKSIYYLKYATRVLMGLESILYHNENDQSRETFRIQSNYDSYGSESMEVEILQALFGS